MANASENMANAFYSMKDYDTALKYYQIALKIKQSNYGGDRNNEVAHTRYNIAQLLRAQGKLAEALKEFQTADSIYVKKKIAPRRH